MQSHETLDTYFTGSCADPATRSRDMAPKTAKFPIHYSLLFVAFPLNIYLLFKRQANLLPTFVSSDFLDMQIYEKH